MTPASEIAISPARTHLARPPGRAQLHDGRWDRVFAVLGVCLPVPLLALSGLSIPIPAGVERIGAALVAWADPSPDGADALGDRGSIVLAAGERVLVQVPSGPEPDTARRVFASVAPLAGSAPGGGAPPKDQSGGSGGGTGNGGNGGGSTSPDPGGDDPGDGGLVDETVKTVTEEPLVEEVDKTLDELFPTGDDESSGGVLEDALSGLGL